MKNQTNETKLNDKLGDLDHPGQDDKADQSNPKVIVKNCLETAFDADSIFTILIYVPKTNQRVSEKNEFDEAIRKIIKFCEDFDETELLWDGIKKERESRYDEFYPQWKKAVEQEKETKAKLKKTGEKDKSTGKDDKNNQSLKKDEGVPKTDNDYERVFLKERPEQTVKDQPHPLDGNDIEMINEWFFNQLNPQDRSLVLTVALFEGINRRHVTPLSKEIAKLVELHKEKTEVSDEQ